jgi:hypothetical protein
MPATQTGGGGPVEHRPRGVCPVCRQYVALTPKTGLVGAHGRGGRCNGTNKEPVNEPPGGLDAAGLALLGDLLGDLEERLAESAELAAQIRARLAAARPAVAAGLDVVSVAALGRVLEPKPVIERPI